jgi:hypothetical protein
VFQIPYGLIPVVAVVWLVARHIRTAPASDRSKQWLAGLAVLAVALTAYWPIVAVVAQVSVCVYVLLHQIITSDADGECCQ